MFDLINGAFELAGAALLLLNVRRLHQDKKLRGVHWGPSAFFTTWGLWNLAYYPALDQWFSFAGGVALVVVNLVWIGQVCYYMWRERAGWEWGPEGWLVRRWCPGGRDSWRAVPRRME